ncbi:MAG: RidA family protein [Planctomycetaceae bacterium]|nr:RidA family protein [Planctomycetaceae bacterium]MCP4461689.1 RidA family protein [Planctomycetaceae bacterium]
MSIEKRLEELGLVLPPAPKAVGVYRPSVMVGNLCMTSGHVPLNTDGSMITGCVGSELDQQAGYEAAKQTGLTILATLQRDLGNLDRIKRVVKLFGMVWCTSDFTQHPAVINGCSELYRDVFGEEIGVGARSAVGMSSLPLGVTVEIEGVFEIHE